MALEGAQFAPRLHIPHLHRIVPASGYGATPVSAQCHPIDVIRVALEGADQRCPGRVQDRLKGPEPGLRRALGNSFGELLDCGQIVMRQKTAHHLGNKLVWILGNDMSGKTNRSMNQIQRFPIRELGTNVVELQVVEADPAARVAAGERQVDKAIHGRFDVIHVVAPDLLQKRRRYRHVFQQDCQPQVPLSVLR